MFSSFLTINVPLKLYMKHVLRFYKFGKLAMAARHGRSSMDHILPVISHITYNKRPSGDLYFTCVVTRALV